MNKYFNIIKDNRYYKWGFVLFIVLSIVLSIVKTKGIGRDSDFYTFYSAGEDFYNGNPLYEEKQGVAIYIYPPFAAMIFQFFSFFPFRIAAIIFYFINFILIPTCIILFIEVLKGFNFDINKVKVPIILSVVFSIKYFWENIIHAQTNAILFFLILFGIYFVIQKKYSLGVVFLVIATNIKIIPIFFVGWLVYRKFRKGIIFSLVIASTISLASPILFRGVNQGIQDYQDFYHKFLKSYQKGQVIPHKPNQNLAAAIYRLTYFYDYEHNLDFRLFQTSEDVTKKIYLFSVLFLLLSVFGYLTILNLKEYNINVFEISVIFLLSHLVSGITWKAHLLTFLFSLFPFFVILKKRINLVSIIILLLIIVTGFGGKDIVGDLISFYIAGFSIYVWLMLSLFFYYLYKTFNPRNNVIILENK